MSAPEANPTKVFKGSVHGYSDEVFRAPSPAKARYRAYRAFCEARPGCSFHQFLINSRVWETTARHDTEGAR